MCIKCREAGDSGSLVLENSAVVKKGEVRGFSVVLEGSGTRNNRLVVSGHNALQVDSRKCNGVKAAASYEDFEEFSNSSKGYKSYNLPR